MPNLAQMHCKRPREGEDLSRQEIGTLHPLVPQWQVEERDGMKRIERTFRFDDFTQALSFTNQVGVLADAEDHHPAILTEWGKITVTLWTHKIGGLHQNDFVLAARTDALFAAAGD